MFEVLPHAERVATWRAAAAGDSPDWDQVFSDYIATVDWPAAHFWRELSTHFPKAKIILSIRDADAWYQSMSNTILPILENSEDPQSIGVKLIKDGVFGGEITDREHLIATFNKNTADVQAMFGNDRLLTLELGSGWEPLCEFLDCPIPNVPYPHGNSSDQFDQNVSDVTDTPSG